MHAQFYTDILLSLKLAAQHLSAGKLTLNEYKVVYATLTTAALAAAKGKE